MTPRGNGFTPPGADGCGTFIAGRGSGRRLYGYREIACQVGGRGFVVGGGDDVYFARVGDPDGNDSCECMAFLRGGECKHLAGLRIVAERVPPAAFDAWGRRMHKLKDGLPPLPAGLKGAEVAANGYPVPWFTARVNGRPDFRVVGPEKVATAVAQRRCWVCGGRLAPVGQPAAFVVGPIGAVVRTSSEPPSHPDCAAFAVRACPFLARPAAKRRDHSDIPTAELPGIHLPHNPGVSAVWSALSWQVERHPEGFLFHLPDFPERVDWFREGRAATREEVDAAFEESLKSAAVQGVEASEVVRLRREVAEHGDRLFPPRVSGLGGEVPRG